LPKRSAWSGFIVASLALTLVAGCSSQTAPPAPNIDAPTTSTSPPTSTPTPPPPPTTPSTTPTPPTPPVSPNTTTTTPAPSPVPVTTPPPAPTPAVYTVDKSKLSKTLNLFNWSEYIPQSILDGFEKEYGVHVNYDTYSSNEEMVAKLEAGGSVYDVAVPSTYMVQSLWRQNMLQPLDLTQLPNFRNIYDGFKNLSHDPGNKFSVPYMWGTVGIAYNTKYVKTTPTSWSDVIDPKYAHHLVVLDDSREVLMMGLQASGFNRNDTEPDHLLKAQNWLKRLVPNVLSWDSDNPKGVLISEDAWIGVVWNGEAALAMKENSNIRYTMPKEGGGLWLDNMVIPKGAPHTYTAHVFINYLLRPEVAQTLGSEFPYGLPNSEGYKLLPASIVNNLASYPPSSLLTKAEYAADLGAGGPLLDRVFVELKAGQ
jgi:spermidine/putrescine transport system permease protein